MQNLEFIDLTATRNSILIYMNYGNFFFSLFVSAKLWSLQAMHVATPNQC